MSFLYFAYGSNMLVERLVHRCPSASVIGLARAEDCSLTFDKASTDGSGKAMLSAGQGSGGGVPGVLFEIARSDLDRLDRAEGVGFGYERDDAYQVITSRPGERIEATTYVATHVEQGLRPYDWYLALVIAGARQQGLDERHVKSLGQTEFLVDSETAREARKIALQALKRSGHPDHHCLLDS